MCDSFRLLFYSAILLGLDVLEVVAEPPRQAREVVRHVANDLLLREAAHLWDEGMK